MNNLIHMAWLNCLFSSLLQVEQMMLALSPCVWARLPTSNAYGALTRKILMWLIYCEINACIYDILQRISDVREAAS